MKQIKFRKIAGEDAAAGPEGSAHVALRPDSRYLMVVRTPQGTTLEQRSKVFEALGKVAKGRVDSASTDYLVLPAGFEFDVYEYNPAAGE